MLNLIDWTCLIGAIASVGIPLLYAVGTLDGCSTRPCTRSFESLTTTGPVLNRGAIIIAAMPQDRHECRPNFTKEVLMVTAMSLMTRDLAKVAHSATVLDAAKMMRERKSGVCSLSKTTGSSAS